MREKHY